MAQFSHSSTSLSCTAQLKLWRRYRGCLQLQVIFRKRATNHRAFLRKLTYKDKASYRSLPPCMNESLPPCLISHRPHTNESRHTYGCVTPPAFEWFTAHKCMIHGAQIYVSLNCTAYTKNSTVEVFLLIYFIFVIQNNALPPLPPSPPSKKNNMDSDAVSSVSEQW